MYRRAHIHANIRAYKPTYIGPSQYIYSHAYTRANVYQSDCIKFARLSLRPMCSNACFKYSARTQSRRTTHLTSYGVDHSLLQIKPVEYECMKSRAALITAINMKLME